MKNNHNDKDNVDLQNELAKVLPATFEYLGTNGERIPVQLGLEHINIQGHLDWTLTDIPDLTTYLLMRTDAGFNSAIADLDERYSEEFRLWANAQIEQRARARGVPERSIWDCHQRTVLINQMNYQVIDVLGPPTKGDVVALMELMSLLRDDEYLKERPHDPFIFLTTDTATRFGTPEELNSTLEKLDVDGWAFPLEDEFADELFLDPDQFPGLENFDIKLIFNLAQYHRVADVKYTMKWHNLYPGHVIMQALLGASVHPFDSDREYSLDMNNWGTYKPKLIDIEKVRTMDYIHDWDEITVLEEDVEGNYLKFVHERKRTLDEVLPFCPTYMTFDEEGEEVIEQASFGFDQISDDGQMEISLLDDSCDTFMCWQEGSGVLNELARFNDMWREELQEFARERKLAQDMTVDRKTSD